MHGGNYRVVIPFREPTFEQRIGRSLDSPPYTALYYVSARSPAEAQERALVEFHRTASQSWVGWIREPLKLAILVEQI